MIGVHHALRGDPPRPARKLRSTSSCSCVSMRSPMTTFVRSLLLFVWIAGCGPTHHNGVPSDGLVAADAFVPIDGDNGSNSGSATCGLTSCSQQNAMCGPIGDGCGGAIDCGSCTTPESCGGGGTLFTCGGTGSGGSCTPRTCAQ